MFSRRSFVATSVMAGAAFADAQAAGPGKALDLTSAEGHYNAITRMRGSLGGEMFMGYVAGRYHGYSGGRLTPLFGLLAGTFSQCKTMPNGDVRMVSFELAYFTDWNSGDVLDTWKNPYTGNMVEVKPFRIEPAPLTLTKDGRVVFDHTFPGGKVDDRFITPTIAGDDVWLTEVNSAESPTANPNQPFVYNEIVSYHARMSDLANPALKSVPTAIGFQAEVTWRPWQQMGDTPGHLVGSGVGRKISRLEDFPARYIPWCKKYHPDIFVELPAFLARGWA